MGINTLHMIKAVSIIRKTQVLIISKGNYDKYSTSNIIIIVIE